MNFDEIIISHFKRRDPFFFYLIVSGLKFKEYYFNKEDSTLSLFSYEVYFQRFSEGIKLNGLNEGLWIDGTNGFWGGRKWREVYYHQGVMKGPYTSYWPNGEKNVELYIKDNKPEGHSIEYFENGQKRLEGDYVNGEKEGLWVVYDEDGLVDCEIVFSNGKEIRLIINK